MRFFGRARFNGEVQDRAGYSLIYSGLNYAAFNAAVLSEPVGGNLAELRRRIQVPARHFESRRLRWTYWLCEDYLTPVVLRESNNLFRQFGLASLTDPPGMYADSVVNPVRELPVLDVRPVVDPQSRMAFAHITSIGFDIPQTVCRDIYGSALAWGSVALSAGFQGFVGYMDGLPVATAATVISGGVVGVYSVATLPAHRGKGYAEALIREVLRRARERTGIEATVLQSTDAGYPLYKRMGYRTLTKFRVYIS